MARGTYVFVVIECVEYVVRKAREEIDDEPTLEIIHADDFGVRNDFSTGTHERRMEIEHDVNEEDHVHDAVHDQKAHVFRRLVLQRKSKYEFLVLISNGSSISQFFPCPEDMRK